MNKQQQIERLLARIRDDVHQLEVLRVRGVRGRRVDELEQALAHERDRLARIVAA